MTPKNIRKTKSEGKKMRTILSRSSMHQATNFTMTRKNGYTDMETVKLKEKNEI